MGGACSSPNAGAHAAAARKTAASLALGPALGALFAEVALWRTVSEYFNVAERWYLSEVKCLQIDSAAAVTADREREIVDACVRYDCPHIFAVLFPQVPYVGQRRDFDLNCKTMVGNDRCDMLELVHIHTPTHLKRLYDTWKYSDQYHSADCGSLEVLKWERRRGYRLWCWDTTDHLVRHGRFHALQQLCLLDGEVALRGHVLADALKSGNVDMVKWLKARGNAMSTMLAEPEYNINSMAMLKCVVEDEIFKYSVRRLAIHVSRYCDFRMFRYAFERVDFESHVVRETLVYWACLDSDGDPAKLAFLLARGYPLPLPRQVSGINDPDLGRSPRAHPRICAWLVDYIGGAK